MNPNAHTRSCGLRFTVLVLAVCFGSSTVTQAAPYWYETYKQTVKLIDAGRIDEADGLLDQLIEDHPVPRHSVRTPGNRFIAYFPYFQRARIERARGDFELASHSLDVCDAFGEMEQVPRAQIEYERFLQQLDRPDNRGTAQAKASIEK